jgi:dipeptidase E
VINSHVETMVGDLRHMTGKLLLLSNSTNFGRSFLAHALDVIFDVLDGCGTLLFVPYALHDHAAYTTRVRRTLEHTGRVVIGLNEVADPAAAIETADAFFIGGGNSFRLLQALQQRDLTIRIRNRVLAGAPYLGASAGTNMACPSLRTTNDMPIVQPASFTGLGLVPFQINPHYVDADLGSRHMGETREARITEFLEDNDVPVLGLREGSWLRVTEGTAEIGGAGGARLFNRGEPAREFAPGTDVSPLLAARPRFDTPMLHRGLAGGRHPYTCAVPTPCARS